MEAVPRKWRPYSTLEKLEMKKTLVALAAVSAVSAFAQSTVTVTGIMDAGYYTGKLYGQAFNVVNNNGARTTAIKFIGDEDIGGGLHAKFQFEVDPSLTANDKNLFNNNSINGSNLTMTTSGSVTTATGTQTTLYTANGTAQGSNNAAAAQPGLVGAGYSYIGLAGGFGEFQFGTINTATLTAFTTNTQMFGTAVGSGYGSGLYGKYTRYENSMMYQSPTFNGLNARVLYAPGNDSQYGTTTTGVVLRRSQNSEYAVSYNQGPISGTAAQIRVVSSPNEASGANNINTTITTVGAKYNFGVASVAAGIQTVRADGATAATMTDTSANNISVQVPMGAMRLAMNIGKYNSNTAATGLVAQGTNKFTAVGVQYDLSKRSFLYATYEKATMAANDFATVVVNGAAGSTSTSPSRNVTVVGISHSF